MPTALCALSGPATANWAGLIGTGLLAYGAARAIPVAARLYLVTLDLAALAETRRKPTKSALDAEDALAQQLAAQDVAWEKLLTDSAAILGAQRERWTRWDTAATITGLVLTLASDGLPLICPSPQPSIVEPADRAASTPR